MVADAGKKSRLGAQLGSKDELFNYGEWSRGVETRVYAHAELDSSVVVHLEGWASAEVIAAYDRGEEGQAWPEFFYTACLDGNGVDYREQPLAGGKIPVSELERYRAECPGGTTVEWAWSFVLDQVEAHV